MKRLLAIVLSLTALLLCSCAKQPQPSTTPDTTGSTQSSTSATTIDTEDIVIAQKAMYAISLPPVTNSAKAEDGTVIFNSSYQNIGLTLPEQEVADNIILDFLNRTDKLIQHAESTLASAKQAYAPNNEWTPYLLQLRYSPQRLDAGILSLYGEKTSYAGGAHAGISGESVSYDLLTGNVLSLADIMRESVTGDTLCMLVTNTLKTRVAQEKLSLFTTYDQTLKQLFRTELADYEDWYFTTEGLTFYFDPYEIAPYSTGVVNAVIPYSELTGILRDAYFPAENDLTSGNLSATPFTDTKADEYTQISEIILEEGTTKILLYTDGEISDIRITADSGSAIFACYTLTPGDAIMVEADLTSTDLLVSYRTGSKYETRSITSNNSTVTVE